jgi:hypothetical protein
MHFTVVFESDESHDLSYGLVFIPCPVWMRGDKEIINLHPARPNYEAGDLLPLLKQENLAPLLAAGRKNAAIVVHRTGHGTEAQLTLLRKDLEQAGFRVEQIRFAP